MAKLFPGLSEKRLVCCILVEHPLAHIITKPVIIVRSDHFDFLLHYFAEKLVLQFENGNLAEKSIFNVFVNFVLVHCGVKEIFLLLIQSLASVHHHQE